MMSLSPAAEVPASRLPLAPVGASIRVMGTAFATGQAAGVAAAVWAQSGAADPVVVRNILLTQNALIDRNAMPPPIDIS